MILGIGCDLAEISRFESWADRSERTEQILSDEEQILFGQKKNRTQWLAGRWAAKEAVAKALGTGFSGFGPKQIAILRSEVGMPYVQLSGRAAELLERMGGGSVHVSISHDGGFVMAFAVIEKQG